MKKLLLFVLAATALAACSTDTTQDLAPEIPTAPDELQVSFDEEDTRIQLQNNVAVWTKDDLVSVFYRSNAHDKYEFTGETGDTSGTLKRVSQGTPTVGLDKVVAIYPYNENYLLSLLSGNIKASLPAEQTYLADSYGLGSSIMISSSKTDRLYMRNVCGWLKLQFTGADTAIKKIVLRGNNDEQVAGDIYICSDDASCTLASDLTGADGVNSGDLEGTLVGTNTIITSVTLNCGDGVALNSETPTAFYIALPPQTFEKGVTITAMCDDGTMRSKSTENSIIVNRNHIVQMASLAVETLETTDTLDTPITPTQPTPAANEIWYTTTDASVATPHATDVFGANIISNTYENGKGVIRFDGAVTTIGNDAFYSASVEIPIQSITLPNSVTSIGGRAFYSCTSLTKISISDNVTEIGNKAFYGCAALTEVVLGKKVETIGERAFYGCIGLQQLTMNGCVINTIGSDVFYNSKVEEVYISDLSAYCKCNLISPFGGKLFLNGKELTKLIIPSDITVIKRYTFQNCSSLTSITIPEHITQIETSAFSGCTGELIINSKVIETDYNSYQDFRWTDGNLFSLITIGNNITRIGNYSFAANCESLRSIAIADGVAEIGTQAFYRCSSLESVNIPNSVSTIGIEAFYGCESIKNITLGTGITSIGNYAFYDCTKLEKVSCAAINPPTYGNRAFWYYNTSYGPLDNTQHKMAKCPIYVPSESVSLYKSASGWSSHSSYIVANE